MCVGVGVTEQNLLRDADLYLHIFTAHAHALGREAGEEFSPFEAGNCTLHGEEKRTG